MPRPDFAEDRSATAIKQDGGRSAHRWQRGGEGRVPFETHVPVATDTLPVPLAVIVVFKDS